MLYKFTTSYSGSSFTEICVSLSSLNSIFRVLLNAFNNGIIENAQSLFLKVLLSALLQY